MTFRVGAPIRPVREKTTEQDSGASALLVAISMFVLMGFTGLAIDGGILFNDRRQQQSAADGGALAAVQFAKTGTPTVECTGLTGTTRAACRGAEEAVDVVDGTLPGRYALVGDWGTCVDASKPVEYTITSSLSDCISFTANFQKARVALPGTDVDTSFARVIGISTVRVGAFAEASLDLDQSAEVIPFAVGPTGAGSNQACLFANSSSNLDVEPCNGPAEGNFGKLDVALYENATLGTPRICGNAQTTIKMGVNLVVGSDHLIEKNFQTPASSVEDFANCPTLANPVDRLNTQTGNSANGIEDGLFTGISTPALEGRLMCKGDGQGAENPATNKISSSCVNVLNQLSADVDDTPLWEFIDPVAALQTVPGGECPADINTRQEMEACLAGWRAYVGHSDEGLFTLGLKDSTRFAAVPILASDPSNGTGTYDVIDFRPVYLSTLYFKCNANTCDVVHSPGEPSSGACPNPLTLAENSCGLAASGNKGIVALTSYMLTLDMLHPEIRDKFPATEGTVVFNLSK